jgi:hypothetical protein
MAQAVPSWLELHREPSLMNTTIGALPDTTLSVKKLACAGLAGIWRSFLPAIAVWSVRDRNRQAAAGERRLIEVAGGLGPDLVGDRVGAIGEPGDSLGQGQRSSLGVAVVGRLPPASQREQALAGLPRRPLEAPGAIEAHPRSR